VFDTARRLRGTIAPDAAHRELLEQPLFDRLGRIGRRDATMIRDLADHFGYRVPVGAGPATVIGALADERGVARLWGALQLMTTTGVGIAALRRWRTPAPDSTVAADLRRTLKARFAPEAWRQVAKPVFDGLRQRQRDALVAYLLPKLGLQSEEQLFEYFLMDPGMEPVVQTSRLRLAIASVQLFIQRCLMNLEPTVHPSALVAEQWAWMKRYRVWEANRKIFLFPENWLEPEFRDDKTHLYRELEGALLQNDASDDLVTDAFNTYLQGLEGISRLEMVTMAAEERSGGPANNLLHVVGRTHAQPHKYYYRVFAHHAWTPWEPVDVEIDGDHVTVINWHDRVHLFWVTFVTSADTSPPAANAGKKVKDAQDDTVAQATKTRVQVRLSWTQRYQGQWAPPSTTQIVRDIDSSAYGDFDPRSVFVHVTKETVPGPDGGTSDGAVQVHLGPPLSAAVRLASRLAAPAKGTYRNPETVPYWGTTLALQATHLTTASSDLHVIYATDVELQLGEISDGTPVNAPILRQARAYALTTAPMAASVGVLMSIDGFDPSIYASPFFYADEDHTFFVEPTVTETTIADYDGYGVAMPAPSVNVAGKPFWDGLALEPSVPWHDPRPAVSDPRWTDPTDPVARYRLKAGGDWLTDPATVLGFAGTYVGEHGDVARVMAAPAQQPAASLFTVVGGGGVTAAVRGTIALAGRGGNLRLTPEAVSGLTIDR
jgi:hypothetical protein